MTQSGAIRGALRVTLVWLGFFAGWTLGSVPLTLLCAPFQALWGAFGLGLLGAGFTVFFLEKPLAPVLLTPAIPSTFPAKSINMLIFGGALAAIVCAVVLFISTANAWPLWLVIILVGAATLSMRDLPSVDSRPELPAEGMLTSVSVVLLALSILALYIGILRPDADDSFYLNLPIGLASRQSCMMYADTMYGVRDWPILGSNYRVEALPTLSGALSVITGLSVITVSHLLIPGIWCIVWATTLVVIGHGLFGRYWWAFAILAVLSSMSFGGTLQTWGVHGIARMFHGKAPLILIVFPFLVYLTFRTEASKTSFGVTFAAMFGLCAVALGLTANAIYLAPLVLFFALFSARIAFPGAPITRLMLIIASAAPVLAGGWLFLFDRPVSANPDLDWSISTTLAIWAMAYNQVLVLALGIILGLGALAARCSQMGRAVTAYTILFLLVAINPILWPLYDHFVTGGLTFRMWWTLPLPTFFACALTWGIIRFGYVRLGTGIVAVFLLAAALMPSGLIGMAGTTIRPSVHKVPPEVIPVIELVMANTQSRATVLAPEGISSWLSIWEGHPPLVYTRQLYFVHSSQAVEPARLAPRKLLAEWINGQAIHTPESILEALASTETRIIVVPTSGKPRFADEILRQCKAKIIGSVASYDVFLIST